MRFDAVDRRMSLVMNVGHRQNECRFIDFSRLALFLVFTNAKDHVNDIKVFLGFDAIQTWHRTKIYDKTIANRH